MNTCSSFFKKCDVTSNRDYSKGKSFSFSKWSPSLTYTNDEFKQDFVTYNGDLYVCIKTNTNVRPTSSSQWCLVVEKLPSEIAFPKIDDFGVLSWEIGSGELPKPTQITGVPGKDGVDGIDGKDGLTPYFLIKDGFLQVSYDGENWENLGNINNNFEWEEL